LAAGGPECLTIDVKDGVVTLRGQLGLRSLIPLAVRLTAAVVDELTYLRDDTTPDCQRFWR
jgi:hypothetical protein